MRVTRLLRASHSGSYQPMIHFVGKRPQGHHSSAPAPHPAAPKDVIDSSFLSKLSQSSSDMRGPTAASSGYSGHRQAPASHEDDPGRTASTHTASSSSATGGGNGNGEKETTQGPISSKPADFENFWEAPRYLWVQKEFSEREMEAVMSGGATEIRSDL